ncbi:PEP-CTERM sorting domain-containing protein [Massilia aquatica]|nr:PEP-CTERM sorting domain-containing protein [Massilia aquatica]
MLAHPLKIVASLVAAGLLACAPAQAAYGNATASLNNIRFELIDLDLTDNISPSITFTSTSASGRLTSYPYPSDKYDFVTSSGFESVDKVFTYGGGSLNNGPASMRAEVHLGPAPRAGSLNMSGSTTQNLNFILSPSTRLLFTAEANVNVQQEGITRPYTSATLNGYMSSTINGVAGYEHFTSALEGSAGAGSEFLRGMLDSGTGVGTGQLSASTYTDFSYYPSAVPEPETYGMLLAGLLVVGGVARRNRRDKIRKA